MLPSFLALLLAPLLLCLGVVRGAPASSAVDAIDSAADTIDNTVLATTIAGLSSDLSPGVYIIRSSVTNLFLSFHYNNETWVYHLFVNDTVSYSWTVGTINYDDDDGSVNGQSMVVASGNKRSIEGGVDQCVYAQWNTPAQADTQVATMTCAWSSPKAKTLWFFVPSTKTTCSSSVPDGATKCLGLFSIVTCDHLLDAPARAMDASAGPELMQEGGTRWGSGMMLWTGQDEANGLWEVWQATS